MPQFQLVGRLRWPGLINQPVVPSPSAPINDGLFILMVYTVVFDCILLVFGLYFCLEYLEGGCLTDQSRFTFCVFFEYIANVSLISVCRTQLHTIMISPCWTRMEGWRALAMNNYCFTMATQHS